MSPKEPVRPKKRPATSMPMRKRYKHTTMRQVGGDDGYQYAVFVHGRERVNGCTRAEAQYYRDRFEREEAAKLDYRNRGNKEVHRG